MARIRTIKPQFWGSKDIVPLSIGARLLALGLVSFADDEGRFIATAKAIGGYVFPQDDGIKDAQIMRWLNEIETTKFAVIYEVDGCRYGVLPKFRSHQRISHPQASILPAPPPEGLF